MKVEILKKDSKKGFALLAGINRDITPSHVTTMATSIEASGPTRQVLVADLAFITGVPTTYIIDGQHLYHALLRMNMDIPYMFIEKPIKDYADLAYRLALLNNSSKSWSMKDYITVWCNIVPDYKKLNNYFNVFDIELTQIADILMNCSCQPNLGGNQQVSRAIKRGEFVIDDEGRAVFLLNCITDALKIVPRMDRTSNKLFISSYVTYINTCGGYDHKKFLVNLKVNKDKFKLVTHDPEEYKKLLKSIGK